jgi:hypothetical protein
MPRSLVGQSNDLFRSPACLDSRQAREAVGGIVFGHFGRRFMRFWLRFALSSLLCAGGASAQSRLNEIATRDTLNVGLSGDYRPFSEPDKETGAYIGPDVGIPRT